MWLLTPAFLFAVPPVFLLFRTVTWCWVNMASLWTPLTLWLSLLLILPASLTSRRLVSKDWPAVCPPVEPWTSKYHLTKLIFFLFKLEMSWIHSWVLIHFSYMLYCVCQSALVWLKISRCSFMRLQLAGSSLGTWWMLANSHCVERRALAPVSSSLQVCEAVTPVRETGAPHLLT